MTESRVPVVNADDAEEHVYTQGAWGHAFRVLTPTMTERGGRLGVNLNRLPPGHAACPFHYHHREDEVFYVLSGRGVLRYGDALREIGPGDCVECPAGTKIAHQIANPFDEDLTYLAMGPHDPHEVCVYPDTGKVMIRGEQRVGFFENAEYMAGEPDRPKIFDLWEQRSGGGGGGDQEPT